MHIAHKISLFSVFLLSLCAQAHGMLCGRPLLRLHRALAVRSFATKDLSTHYAALRLKPNASKQEIEQSYRKRLIETHPDTAQKYSREEFDAVRAAHKALLNTPQESTAVNWLDKHLEQHALYKAHRVLKDGALYTIKNKKIVGDYSNQQIENTQFYGASIENARFMNTAFQEVAIHIIMPHLHQIQR